VETAVLLTGGTGMLGSEFCSRLLAERKRRVYILTRQPSGTKWQDQPGAVVVQGDIVAPGLGLSPDISKEIRESVSDIVHCAADTRFGLPIEVIRRPNVTGTRNVLDFALSCRRLEKFVHVSTAYVAGRGTGSIPEEPQLHNHGFFNTYQQSKYEAEDLVLSAMDRLPAAIIRFSSIIGDSRTGKVTRFNYVHQLLRLFPRNVLPVAPGHPDVPIDLVSTEWAAAGLKHLVTSAFSPGQVFHLCAGPERSLTVREMMDTTVAQFESNETGRTWLPIQLPRLVSLSEFEVFAAESRSKGDKLLNSLLTALGHFLPHLAVFQLFETGRAAKALESSPVVLPHAREYFPRVIDYCLDTKWVGKRRITVPA
jgi:nucleoside-diphosphate-sugar epimerase